MEFYNKIMLYFWLATSVVSALVISYLCFSEGFDRWMYYYTIPLIALMMYVVRKWMMKRMEKHLKFLEEQHKKKD